MPRFIVDEHAGKFARWLRLLGCDTLYFNPVGDLELAEIAARDERVVLTRDTSLAGRFPGVRVVRLESDDPFEQLAAVVRMFGLDTESGLFSRCLVCNALLEAIDKEDFKDAIPPVAFERCSRFARCTGCGKFYWDGTHYARMKRKVETMNAERGTSLTIGD